MIHQLKAIIGFQENGSTNNNGSVSSTEAGDALVGAGAAKVKIADLGLSARVASALENAGIKSAAGLARKTASALKEIDGIGDKAVGEIAHALAGFGLTLKGE